VSTTSTPKTRTIPAPFYAAAGAADLAYQALRELQAKVAEQGVRPTRRLDLDGDIEKLRAVAKRNTDAFLARAQAAQDKAVALYSDLVVRGEKVVKGGVRETRSTVGEIEATVDADARTTRRTRATTTTSSTATK
jgi:heparin binding hemagglutinin HbhA